MTSTQVPRRGTTSVVDPAGRNEPRAGRPEKTVQSAVTGLTSTLLALTLCFVVPLFVTTTMPYTTVDAVPLEVAMALLILGISGLRLSLLIGTGRPELFSFAFWLFAYVFLAVPAFAQTLTHRYPGTTPNIHIEYHAQALVVVLLGLVAVLGGQELIGVRRRRTRTEADLPHPEASPWTLDKTRILLLALAGLAAWGYYVSRIGASTFFTNREQMSAAIQASFPDPATATIVTSAATLPLLVCVHAMTRYRRAERLAFGVAANFTLMLPAALLAVIWSINIFTSSRYLFGTMAFSLLALWGGFATRARARTTMTALLVLVLAAFPLFSIFRRATVATESELGAAAYVNSGDYDAFAQVVNSVNYVAIEGVLWGKQLLGPLVFWVPRSVWPDKPIDTGVMLAQFRGYSFNNLSAPFWSEAYLSGGWVGVIILFLALGWVLRSADMRVSGSLQNAGAFGITMAILSFYMLILLRGSLLQATSTLAVIVTSILLVTSRRRGTESRRRDTVSADIATLRHRAYTPEPKPDEGPVVDE
jgi:hypothetical protein